MTERILHRLKEMGSLPIYRRTVARLSRLRPLHWLILFVGILGLVTIIGGVPLAIYLPCSPARIPNFPWSTPALVAVFGLFLTQEILKSVLVFSGAMLGSASVGLEDATAKHDPLALTPITPQMMTRSRLAAVIRVLLLPLLIVVIARMVLLIAIEPRLMERLFTFMASMPDMNRCFFTGSVVPPSFAVGSAAYRLLSAVLWRLDVLHTKFVFPLWAASYIVQPLLDALVFAMLGIMAATRSRSRSNALALTVILVAVLGIVSYIGKRASALMLSTLWAVSIGVDPRVILLPPWDFGGGIYPPGMFASLWMVGLPAVTPGVVESMQVFEILWPAGFLLKSGYVWLSLRAASGTLE